MGGGGEWGFLNPIKWIPDLFLLFAYFFYRSFHIKTEDHRNEDKPGTTSDAFADRFLFNLQ